MKLALRKRAVALFERIGRRGAALIFIGLLEISAGSSFLSPTTPTDQFHYLPLINNVPIVLWGCVWVVSGLSACVASLWKSGKDGWGFQAAYPVLALWGSCVLAATLTGVYPTGTVRGIFGCLIYYVIMAFIFIVSGMDGARSLRHTFDEDGPDYDETEEDESV